MARRLFVIIASLLALGLVLYGAVAGYALYKASSVLHEGQARALDEQQRFGAAVLAEQERWRADPLFAKHAGGDAAEVLSRRVGFDRHLAPQRPPDDVLADLADAGADWPSAGPNVAAVDLDFFSSLADAGYWDLESEGSPLRDLEYRGMEDPGLIYSDVLKLAKLRLLRGLQTGQMRPALDEVHELARLCLTTESLVGSMVAVAILDLERKAAAEATARGLELGGFRVRSAEDTESLKRTLWAAPHATSLLSPDEPLAPDFPMVGRCAALNELAIALYVRPWATAALPSRYETLTRMLETSDCRLRRLRHAWATSGEGELSLSSQAFCQTSGTSGGICDAPDFWVRLPLVRPAIGSMLAASSTPDWFKRYHDAGTP